MTRSKKKFIGFYLNKNSVAVKEEFFSEILDKAVDTVQELKYENSGFLKELRQEKEILATFDYNYKINEDSKIDYNAFFEEQFTVANNENIFKEANLFKKTDNNDTTNILKDNNDNTIILINNPASIVTEENINNEFNLEKFDWVTRSTKILNSMVGKEFLIYNGKNNTKININFDMFNNNFGEFSFTRKLGKIHSKKKK